MSRDAAIAALIEKAPPLTEAQQAVLAGLLGSHLESRGAA